MKINPLKVRIVTVSSKGQFTIPQDHRKRLGIQPGDKGLSYQIGNFGSCKFFGDSVRLCGSLLREPQVLPQLIELDHFYDTQSFTTCGTPTHPFVLLACPDDLIDPFLHPATANGFAGPLATTVIDDLRLMLLEVRH